MKSVALTSVSQQLGQHLFPYWLLLVSSAPFNWIMLDLAVENLLFMKLGHLVALGSSQTCQTKGIFKGTKYVERRWMYSICMYICIKTIKNYCSCTHFFYSSQTWGFTSTRIQKSMRGWMSITQIWLDHVGPSQTKTQCGDVVFVLKSTMGFTQCSTFHRTNHDLDEWYKWYEDPKIETLNAVGLWAFLVDDPFGVPIFWLIGFGL